LLRRNSHVGVAECVKRYCHAGRKLIQSAPQERWFAVASETSGPPPIESTHSLTIANAGSMATTGAKNPTRAGHTETPAARRHWRRHPCLSRNAGNRPRLTTMSVRIRGGQRDYNRPTLRQTADRDVPPQRSSAQKGKSPRRGRTIKRPIARLTLTTTPAASRPRQLALPRRRDGP